MVVAPTFVGVRTIVGFVTAATTWEAGLKALGICLTPQPEPRGIDITIIIDSAAKSTVIFRGNILLF